MKLWFSISVYSPQKEHFVAVFDQITERKQAEADLRVSESKFKAAFDYAPIGISLLDQDRNLVELNTTLEKITRVTKEELFAGVYRKRKYLRPDGTEMPGSELASARAIQENRPVLNVQTGILLEDGQTIWTSVSAAPFDHPSAKYIVITEDISDRKRSEQALQESEEKYRLIAENSNDWIYWLLPNKQLRHVSPSCEQVTGYSPAEFIQDPDLLHKIALPEDRELMRKHLVHAITENAEGDLEYRIMTKTGSIRWIGHTCKPAYTSDGTFIGRQGTNRDITERKQAEQANQEANARLRQFVDFNIVGVVIANSKGDVLEANDYYLNLIGLTRIDLLEKKVDWRAITPSEWLPADEQAIQEMGQRGKCEPYEKEYIRPDGSRVPVLLVDTMLPGPDEQIAAFVIDLTERKKAEAAVLASEDKFKYVFDHSLLGKSITQPTGEMDVNQAFCDMLGYTAQELRSKKWQELTHPEDVESTDHELAPLLSGEKDSLRMVKRYIHKDGTTVWADLSTRLRRDKNGKPLYFMSSIMDITDRKTAEQEIITLNGRLQVLISAIQELAASRDLDTIVKAVPVYARRLTGSDGSSVVLREGDQGYFAGEDAIQPPWKEQRFPISASISGWVMLNRQSKVIEDIDQDPLSLNPDYKNTFVKGLVMVPIRMQDPLGAIENYWAGPHKSTEMEVQLVQTLADAAAQAVENVQSFR